jgi:hypothetical protein
MCKQQKKIVTNRCVHLKESLVVFQDTFPFPILHMILYSKLGPIATNETKVAMVATNEKNWDHQMPQ